MRELERNIYTKGLKNAYGSILLGEQDQALAYIEDLVYLTRELAASGIQQSVAAEVALLEHIRAVCWPDMQLSIQMGDSALSRCKIARGKLADAVCPRLFEADGAGLRSVTLLLKRTERDGVAYQLLEGCQEVGGGLIADG